MAMIFGPGAGERARVGGDPQEGRTLPAAHLQEAAPGRWHHRARGLGTQTGLALADAVRPSYRGIFGLLIRQVDEITQQK